MNAPLRFGKPYVWVTWITSLLAGEKQCVWAAWFRAHYRYQKRVDATFDRAAWSTDHAALVQSRAAELVRDGWLVRVENQNSLKLEGKLAVLAGKPDIIAKLDDEVLIVDAKTGQQRASDMWQLIIYMVVFWRTYRGATDEPQISGEVAYPSARVPVRADAVSKERETQLFEMLRVIGGEEEPARVPSAFECAFCDISECPDRIKEEPAASAETSEF